MAQWTHVIWIGDVFRNPDLTFPQRRDAIVERLSTSAWLRQAGPDSAIAESLQELRDVQDEDEFDDVWNDVYDCANIDRAWIDTISPNPGTR